MGCRAVARGRTQQPCGACRLLRRRCDKNCVLAPYFPGDEIEKFAGVHKVFGASNAIKMIQMVEESKREDAVKAIVYEATARLRDPVYGSAGAIFRLQKMAQELKAQVESTRVQVLEIQKQRDQLLGMLMNNARKPDFGGAPDDDSVLGGGNFSVDDYVMAYDSIQFCDKV